MWPNTEAHNVFFDDGERPFTSIFDWLLLPHEGGNSKIAKGLKSLTRIAINRSMSSPGSM